MSRKRLGNNPLSFIRSTRDADEAVSNVEPIIRKQTSAAEELEPEPEPTAPAVPEAAAEAASEVQQPVASEAEALAPAAPEPTPEPEAPTAKVQPVSEPTAPPPAEATAPSIKPLPDPLQVEFPEPDTSDLPKYMTFDEKISVLFRSDQVEYLDQIAKVVMRKRSRRNKKERITKNTVLRAMVDYFKGRVFDYEEITDEEELLQRLVDSQPRT